MDKLNQMGIGLTDTALVLLIVFWLVFTFYLAPKLGIPTWATRRCGVESPRQETTTIQEPVEDGNSYQPSTESSSSQ